MHQLSLLLCDYYLRNMDYKQEANKDIAKKNTYALAAWWQRLLARLLDFLAINAIGISILIILCVTDNIANGSLKNITLMQPWRFLVAGLLCAILYCVDFLFIPCWTKGRTLGLWICRLQIHNLIPTKKFIFSIIKKEAIVWFIFAIANILVGIAIMTMTINERSDFFSNFWNFTTTNNNNESSKLKIWTTVIHALYMVGMLVQIFLIANIIMTNKRRCFIDNISETCVIYLKPVNKKDKQGLGNTIKTKKKNYGLPGEIVGQANEEIDSL